MCYILYSEEKVRITCQNYSRKFLSSFIKHCICCYVYIVINTSIHNENSKERHWNKFLLPWTSDDTLGWYLEDRLCEYFVSLTLKFCSSGQDVQRHPTLFKSNLNKLNILIM